MESYELNMMVHFANNLENMNSSGKPMNPCLVFRVYTSKGKRVTSSQIIKAAKVGGSNPIWESPIQINFQGKVHETYIVECHIYVNRHKLFFERFIGEVNVPLVPADGKKLWYDVEGTFGRKKGELVLSHILSKKSVEKKS